MADFPIQAFQDSSFFSEKQADVSIAGQMEGGYSVTRPRTTRLPRKTFTTGYTEIKEADVDALQSFYDTHGQYASFSYTHPIKLTTHTCRITAWPESKYTGSGGTHRFNFGPIKITEV